MKAKNTSAVLLLPALLAVSSFAQEFRGRIQGIVIDTSQAAVVGATVTIVNAGTGVAANRQTNDTGHYLFDLVEPGAYSVAVEFSGFSKFVRENVLLQQRGDVTVNATLRAGDIKETVTVAAEANAVQFNTAKLETTVMPFLLRAVNLLGINTSAAPRDLRLAVWKRIGTDVAAFAWSARAVALFGSLARICSVRARTSGADEVTRTFGVANVNTLSTSFGKHGSRPSGIACCHGGCNPIRISSAFKSPLHVVFARATSLVRLRVSPWDRMRTTSSARHLAGA